MLIFNMHASIRQKEKEVTQRFHAILPLWGGPGFFSLSHMPLKTYNLQKICIPGTHPTTLTLW